jgi:hypothetical protein
MSRHPEFGGRRSLHDLDVDNYILAYFSHTSLTLADVGQLDQYHSETVLFIL